MGIDVMKLYKKTQESLSMLKILAQSRKNLEEGKFRPARKSFSGVKEKIKGFHILR